MPNELKETMELMNSADYKDRFKAEYYQVAIRYQKLSAMLENGIKECFRLLQLVREVHIIYR